MVVMAVVQIPAETITQALDARIKEMRDNYGREPHVSIEYINGFEDAATMVTRVIEEASTHGPS